MLHSHDILIGGVPILMCIITLAMIPLNISSQALAFLPHNNISASPDLVHHQFSGFRPRT